MSARVPATSASVARAALLTPTTAAASPAARDLFARYSRACPLNFPTHGRPFSRAALFARITQARYFYVQGCMEVLGLQAIFFVEGDNLLTRPVADLAAVYGARHFDASILHVSAHAIFMNRDFVEALNTHSALVADLVVGRPSGLLEKEQAANGGEPPQRQPWHPNQMRPRWHAG